MKTAVRIITISVSALFAIQSASAVTTSTAPMTLPTITVIHQSAAYQNQKGHLKILIGAFKRCIFQSTTPIKAGATLTINLNNIAQYQQVGSDCTQQSLEKLIGFGSSTSYTVMAYYPALKLQSSCQMHFIKRHSQNITVTMFGYLPANFFRSKGQVTCGFATSPLDSRAR